MLARLARQSAAGRRRLVPSSSASSVSNPTAVVTTALAPPSLSCGGSIVGEGATAIAARHLHYARASHSRLRYGGASSSALSGRLNVAVASRGGEDDGGRAGRPEYSIGTLKTSAVLTGGPYPPLRPYRCYSASAFEEGAAALLPRNALARSTQLSLSAPSSTRPLHSAASAMTLNGGFGGGGGYRGSDNPLFMRTMDNIVRRAMSSSAQTQPAEDRKTTTAAGATASTVYDSEKMKTAAAIPPPPPVGTAKKVSASASASSSSSTAAKKRSELTNPPTLMGTITDFVQSIPGKAKDLTMAAAKAIVRFLAATPGVLWFYMTHPSEFRQKLTDLKEAAKKEAHHYWMGSKLLAADLRTARGLLNQTLRGSPLTRRERKQLLRTVSDVFRLVPMSVFVLVPFMEFALPFALKIFPNMLPSTFQDSLKAEENMKRELRSRIAMAEFFQETLQDLAKEQKKRAISKIKASEEKKKEASNGNESDTDTDTSIYDRQEETAASFLEFIEKARKGEMIPPEVIIKFSSYFQDELTLDNMPRMQLVNMSRYMGLPPYGSDNFLRLQLRFKIRSLLEDDQRILWEGIDSLTKMELREACQERGMRSTGLSKEAYKRALQQWLDLSVNKNVPISLLIMSRTFFLQEEMTSRTGGADDDGSKSLAGLADAISGLDKEVLNEVVLEVASAEEKVSNPDVVKIKLDVLEHQNELIAEEKKERDEAAAKKKEREEEKLKAEAAEQIAAAGESSAEAAEGKEAEKLEAAAAEIAVGVETKVDVAKVAEPAPTAKSSVEEPQKEPVAEAEKEEMAAAEEEEKEKEKEEGLSAEEMEALSQIASPDPVHKEREDLATLKAAMKKQEEEEEEEEAAEDTTAEFVVDTSVDAIDVSAVDETKGEAEVRREEEAAQKAEEPAMPVEPTMITDESDREAAERIAAMDTAAKAEAEASTEVSFEGKAPAKASAAETAASEETPPAEEEEEEEEESRDERLDKAYERLKSRVESMVGKIEVQLSDVEAKIGDKLHILDKDRDDIISSEEMAQALQTVLKRKLTLEEAIAIAEDMDTDKDGFVTVEELVKWVDANKLVKLVEEGRDGEVDRMIAKQAAKLKEKLAKEAVEADGLLEGESSSQDEEAPHPPKSSGLQ